MKMRQASEQAEITGFSCEAFRQKIGIALLTLMGSSLTPGCHFNADLSTRLLDKARDSAVDGGKNAKYIWIPEARVSVLLGREEAGDKKIKALLYLGLTSPLRLPRNYPLIYRLPDDAAPWEKLVMEPSGHISLRMKRNILTVQFDCGDDQNNLSDTCVGDEIDPEKLAEEQAVQKVTSPESRNETEKTETAETGGMEEPKVPEAPASDTPEVPSRIFVDGEARYSTTPEIKAQLEALRSAMEGKIVSPEDTNWLKIVARELAKETQWAAELEEIIRDMENDSQTGQFKRLNLVMAIQFLLAQKPQHIPKLADMLGVTLPNSQE